MPVCISTYAEVISSYVRDEHVTYYYHECMAFGIARHVKYIPGWCAMYSVQSAHTGATCFLAGWLFDLKFACRVIASNR